MMTCGKILQAVKDHVSSYAPDVLPIIVAVADPTRVATGVTVQRDYPLTKIERKYGIPFGRLTHDPTRFISNPDELHGCKWGIEVHEAVFQNDILNQQFIRTGRREGRIVSGLSTGMGNVLQNPRIVAYIDRRLYHVVGEPYDQPPPYTCLVEYEILDNMIKHPIGMELLLFTDRGCLRVDKDKYLHHPSQAIHDAEKDFESQIRWAVSGYPLLLCGKPIPDEITAKSVSDYRHLWKLPKLQHSLINKLAKVSEVKDAEQKLEFYFGFEQIQHDEYFVPATKSQPITMPLLLTVPIDVLETLCSVCAISEDKLLQPQGELASDPNHWKLAPDDVRKDFIETGYTEVLDKAAVVNAGQFFIDEARQEITVRLLPAIYPHHIVGVFEDGRVVNISISGRSGVSGITIEFAKLLCKEAGLKDAIIVDNGNDVVARMGGGTVICHDNNVRQTRLTAALHFGYLIQPKAFGGSLDGLEMAYSTATVNGAPARCVPVG